MDSGKCVQKKFDLSNEKIHPPGADTIQRHGAGDQRRVHLEILAARMTSSSFLHPERQAIMSATIQESG